MKKALSKLTISLFCIHILFASMLPNVDATDIVKFPNLVSHFYYHHQKDSSISFIEFVNMHYGAKSIVHNKQENHSKLPFQSTHSFDNVTTYIALNIEIFETNLNLKRTSYSDIYIRNHKSNYSESIWQPPKNTILS